MSQDTEDIYRYLVQQAMSYTGATNADQGVIPQNNARQQQMIRQLSVPKRLPYIKIIEQPAPKGLRFRYECEGKTTGAIQGVHSTSEKKTFPTIQVVGYRGRAMVVVSCVTKDPPYMPHPHNIIGGLGCDKGVCTLEIPIETMTTSFSLAIQCVKRKDIEESLRFREKIRVDPFRTGFNHSNTNSKIDLNILRLCFQVFIEGKTPGKFCVPLKPVVSDPIHDKKGGVDLTIVKLSDCVSYVDGGKKDVILLCEKVNKEDIQIRFYENDGEWEVLVDPSQVHKQHAICFKTPKYKHENVEQPVKVFLQLRRPSDGETSKPVPFELLPVESEPGAKRKRQKMDDPDGILKVLDDYQNAIGSYESCNPHVNRTPEYNHNLPHQNHSEKKNVINNPDLIEPLDNVVSSQSPTWNIAPNPPSQVNDILEGFDTHLNSEEVDATLKSMIKDSEPLPEIGNLSLSDIVPSY